MTQLARLYLRGSLINKTMRNLTQKQMDRVDDKINELLHTSSLTKCREAFCRALAKTIRNEYADKHRPYSDAAMQEYRIAIMRAVVNAMYHKPSPEVFTDPKQLAKYFKTMVFNYLRQILNENRIPSSSVDVRLEGPSHEVARSHFCFMLDQAGVEYDLHCSGRSHDIAGTISLIDLDTAKKFGQMAIKYRKVGVDIKVDQDRIQIDGIGKPHNIKLNLKQKIRLKMTSFESEDDDKDLVRYNLEFKILRDENAHSELEENDNMRNLRSMLPDKILPLFDLILDVPDDYIKKYGPGEPRKNHMAKYLGITQAELNRRMEKLKLYYMAAV